MATKPQFEQDAEAMQKGNLVSYATDLRKLYKKPKTNDNAEGVPTKVPNTKLPTDGDSVDAGAKLNVTKKRKPAILGGANPNMDSDVEDNL